MTAFERAAAARQRRGYTYTHRTTFMFDGASVSRESTFLQGTPGVSVPGACSEQIYTRDLTVTLGGPVGPLPKGHAMSGEVRRNRSQAPPFERSLVEAIFLAHLPVLPYFPPSHTTLGVGAPGSVVLCRRLDRGSTSHLEVARLIVSDRQWRPEGFDLVDLRANRVVYTLRARGFRQSVGGAWLPSAVTTTDILLDGQVLQTWTYRLQRADLNEAATVTALRGVVPPGTALTDYRFNAEGPVSYTVTKAGLPSDKQVWAMIQQVEQARRMAALRRRLSILFYLGPLAVVLILVWRRRTPAGSSLQDSGVDGPAVDGPGKRDGASDDGSSHIDSDAGPAP